MRVELAVPVRVRGGEHSRALEALAVLVLARPVLARRRGEDLGPVLADEPRDVLERVEGRRDDLLEDELDALAELERHPGDDLRVVREPEGHAVLEGQRLHRGQGLGVVVRLAVEARDDDVLAVERGLVDDVVEERPLRVVGLALAREVTGDGVLRQHARLVHGPRARHLAVARVGRGRDLDAEALGELREPGLLGLGLACLLALGGLGLTGLALLAALARSFGADLRHGAPEGRVDVEVAGDETVVGHGCS